MSVARVNSQIWRLLRCYNLFKGIIKNTPLCLINGEMSLLIKTGIQHTGQINIIARFIFSMGK